MEQTSSIRKVKQRDLELILGVLKGQIGEMYFGDIKKEVDDICAGKAIGFVAEMNGTITGYVCCRKRVEVAYLETIAVKPRYQGKGFGRRLLEEAIETIKKEYPDIKVLNVITDTDAHKTIGFYLKNGFEISGYVSDEFIFGVRQAHLVKIIR